MAASSRFTVGRAACAYVVPREHPAPEDVRRRADVVFHERIPSACARVLSLLAPADDPSVWLIDRLDVDVALGGALDEHLLAETWSIEIARALAHRLNRGEGVVRFPTRAAFVARFIVDAASGRDAGKWYYAQFDSLRALPTSAKIREAIVREPELAFAIIAELVRANRVDEVIAALGDRGAHEIWATVFPPNECEASPRLLELLLSFWEGAALATPQLALRLAASALRHTPDATPAAIRAHVDALLVLAEAMRVAGDDAAVDSWRFVEALVDGDLAAALRIVDRTADSLAAVAPLRLLIRVAATRPDLITCAASTLRASATSIVAASDDSIVASAFAGYALLLPFLPEIDCVARALVLAKCSNRDDLRFDPLVQLLRGDDEDDGIETPCAEEELIAIAESVMAAFAAGLPGFARSSAAHLRENFLSGHGAIRFARDRVDVFLPRVPLALLLRITGVDGKTFMLPWMPERPVTLLLPEDA